MNRLFPVIPRQQAFRAGLKKRRLWKMKIALVTEWLDAWRGGAETSTQQFLHHLMDRGVDLHVFTRSRPSPTPGLSVHSINGAAMSRTRKSVTFGHRVERRLREESFDIIHAITPCRGATIYQPRGGTVAESIERNIALRRTQLSRRLKRCANRFNFKQRYMLGLEREFFSARSTMTVVAISDYVKRQLQDHYALPDSRICKIYNGVDCDETPGETRAEHRRSIRTDFGIGDDDLLILSVAHNFRLKGIHRWMEAMAQILAGGTRNVHSIVIGRGESPAWIRLAQRLGVSGFVKFVGPSDRVRAFYHAADVLVHPTYYDPCSRVVLEGMVSGLPVITTRWDGSSEMIRDGENGFLLDDPSDTQRLVRLVAELQDRRLRRSVGAAAAEVSRRVSMARHADEILALYERVADQSGVAS